MPRDFLFQNGICLHGKTWVSKFFVTQSRFAKGFGSVVKKREVGQSFFLFLSYNDLSHEKITVINTVIVNKYARKGSVHSSLSHTKITSPFEKLLL